MAEEKALFESSWLGTKVKIFPDKLVETKMLGLGSKTIPTKQISSVNTYPLLGNAKVETTGGKVYSIAIGVSPALLKRFKEILESVMG